MNRFVAQDCAESLAQSEIKAVLVQSIALVVNLKAQITNIVRFFKAVEIIVEFVLNKQVKPFINAMRADTAFEVGQYAMIDLQRSVSSACFKVCHFECNKLRVLYRLFSTARS